MRRSFNDGDESEGNIDEDNREEDLERIERRGIEEDNEEEDNTIVVDEELTSKLKAIWQSPEELELRNLCTYAGISQNQFVKKLRNITKIDILQADRLELKPISYFVSLVDIQIICQSEIKDMEGLETLINLESLILSECSITRISNIGNCTKLKRLVLSNNFITKIEGLETLTSLEELWLFSNKIKVMEGLQTLVNLKVLNIAQNFIQKIGTSLDKNVSLEDLNFSDNKIGCLKEILNLARLSTLKCVCFTDPHFGKNPVCDLCNYQTYILYHLSQVNVLDSLFISEESKQLAEATYMKKKMYYNMRIKTLKRNTSSILNQANTIREEKINYIQENLVKLIKIKKELLREVEEGHHLPPRKSLNQHHPAAVYATTYPDAYLSKVKTKINFLNNMIDKKTMEVKSITSLFQSCQNSINESSKESISRLIIELETGGNIRLEEGKPSDIWYSSCVDLVKTRFNEKDFLHLGIEGVKVLRVTRIHNRYLRNVFEEKADQIARKLKKKNGETGDESQSNADNDNDNDIFSDQKHGRLLNYLFFSELPILSKKVGNGNELLSALEDGFRTGDEYEEMGLPGAICVSNSLLISDAPRIKSYLAKSVLKKSSCNYATSSSATSSPSHFNDVYNDDDYDYNSVIKNDSGHLSNSVKKGVELLKNKKISLPQGQMLIVKAFIGNTAPDEAIDAFHSTGEKMKSQFFESYLNFHENKNDDNKQTMWYMFDPTTVLPEYLIEYDYIINTGVKESVAVDIDVIDASTAMGRSGKAISAIEQVDITPLLNPLNQFNTCCKDILNATTRKNDEDDYNKFITMEPVVPSRIVMNEINNNNILEISRFSHLSEITYLNLHDSNLKKIEHLDSCVNLKHLILSFNQIVKIEGLMHLRKLLTLNVSFNLIKRIENITTLSLLDNLDLSSNSLYIVEDISILQTSVPTLTVLKLNDNPITELKNYRSLTIRKLYKLVELDDVCISDGERKTADEAYRIITPSMIINSGAILSNGVTSMRSCSSLKGRSMNPLSILNINNNNTSSLKNNNNYDGSSGDSADVGVESSFFAQVEQLDLNHMNIRELHNLDKMVNLRRASFADNEIIRIEGLDKSVLLEELCLEDNRILKMEGLATLIYLKKLDLGKNKLTKVEGLETLVHLSQLSLEDNDISSLSGLSALTGLMELYIGNNRVNILKEVQNLKELPKLIILDLSGNPICKQPNHRIYAIYYLRKLKVLDGCGVDSSEQASAREKYAGKLTTDFLIEKIGHKFFEHIRELDLSSCRIRQLETLCGDDFCNLREINLNNNLISDISGLKRLPLVNTLRLNYNRIVQLSKYSDFPENGVLALCNLEVLQLINNQIQEMSELNLHAMPKLTVLHLQENEISRLSGLDKNTELRELILDKNRIKHLDGFALSSLINLKELRIEDNGLKTMSGFNSMVKLHSLYLGSNRIHDATEIDKLEDISFLQELTLSNNPVSRKQFYRPKVLKVLPFLSVLDGREVTADEREKYEVLYLQQNKQQIASFPQDPRLVSPIKLTSVNLDSISAYRSQSLTQGGPDLISIGGTGIANNMNNTSFLDFGRDDSRWNPAFSTVSHLDDNITNFYNSRNNSTNNMDFNFSKEPFNMQPLGKASPQNLRRQSSVSSSSSFTPQLIGGDLTTPIKRAQSLSGGREKLSLTFNNKSSNSLTGISNSSALGRRPVGPIQPPRVNFNPRNNSGRRYI